MVTVPAAAPGAVELVSALPAAIFIIPILAGLAILVGGRRRHRFSAGVALLAAATVAVLAVIMAVQVRGGAVLTTWAEELRVDGLSALVLLVVGIVGLMATIYSTRYLEHSTLRRRAGVGRPTRRLAIFYALLVWCLGTMAWVAVTNNVVMLWIAVEATTLTTGLLVAFFWDRRALEAGYKYLMLLTVGITFALFGCVVIYAAAAATGELTGREALMISRVAEVIHLIPERTALLAVGMLIIGFGMKAGLAPFHTWLPDAHAEAPTPVSVLLSGVMIKAALYALARTVSLFFPSIPALTVFLVGLGVFTMVLGVVLALTQDDLKRLLAYSSVSQMGYVLAGVALGTYLGAFGGLFHLMNHALFKALLFMAVGAVIFATGARRVSELGGLGKHMPITALCFLVGALAISGFPPFNGFLSKLTVYLALAESGLWWAVVLAVGTSLLTMVALIRPAYRVFWAAPAAGGLTGGAAGGVVGGAEGEAVAVAVREVPAALWVPMVVLAALCVLLGLVPAIAHALLNHAAIVLATLVG
jgi:hydrogenase-4 component F